MIIQQSFDSVRLMQFKKVVKISALFSQIELILSGEYLKILNWAIPTFQWSMQFCKRIQLNSEKRRKCKAEHVISLFKHFAGWYGSNAFLWNPSKKELKCIYKMISGSVVVLIMELELGSVLLDNISLHQSQQVFNFRPFALTNHCIDQGPKS